jgi:hypothetical protein
MIRLQSGKKIRLYSAGNPKPKIYFDKFEEFNKISIRPASLELHVSKVAGTFLKGTSLRKNAGRTFLERTDYGLFFWESGLHYL